MANVSLINGHIDKPSNTVYCKDCKFLMFSDFYGECSQGYKGVVHPYDYCNKGERKDDSE